MPTDLSSFEEPDPDAEKRCVRLLDQIAGASKGPAREEAEQALLAMDDGMAQIITREVTARIRVWSRESHASNKRCFWYIVGAIGGVLTAVLARDGIGVEHSQTLAFSAGFVALGAMLVDGYFVTTQLRAKQNGLAAICDALLKLRKVSLIPLFLQIYVLEPQLVLGLNPQRHRFGRALVELLPYVAERDAHLFSAVQLRQLHSVLHQAAKLLTVQKPALTVAVLQVIQLLGDTSAIPIVSHLSTQGAAPSICEAAKACLATLNQRSLQPSQTLLRGSSPSEIESDVLLRAAMSGRSAQEEELLRAHDGQASRANVTTTESESNLAGLDLTEEAEEANYIQVGLSRSRPDE